MRGPRTTLSALLGVIAAVLCGQTFRERVDVDLVRVELLALDSKGQPVGGLKASDFTIRVDGKLVKTESFEDPRATAGPATLAPTLPPLPVAIARADTEASHPVAPQSAPRPTYSMAILVDEASSEQSNRQAVLGEVFQFLQRDLPPGMQVLLMRFNGTLRIECPWTADVLRLRAAAAALGQRREAPLLGDPRLVSTTTGQASFRLEFDALEAIAHVRSSLAGLFDALRVFPEGPGRKALYVITDGTPFLTPSDIVKNLIATAPADDPFLPRGSADLDRDLLVDSLAWDRTRTKSLLTDIARLALIRGVEIHPVMSAPHDASGRVRTDKAFSERATASAGQPAVDRGRSLRFTSQRAAEVPPATDISAGQSMEAVAETTGGDAVLSRRMLQDEIHREVENRDAAHLLTFRDPFAGDHLFHKIDISSSRPGIALRYRRGYRVLDTREELVQKASNRLYLPADDNPLGVRLRLDSLGQEKGLATAEVTVAYPATPEAGGRGGGEPGAIQIMGICSVRDGLLSEPIDLSGKAERVPFGDATWLVRAGQFRLKPGAYRFSFAIRDEQTGITSYLTFERKLP